MLTLYRRHRPPCPHTLRKYRKCKCPIWVQGSLAGEYVRKSLDLRSWEAASNLVRDWETAGEMGVVKEIPQCARRGRSLSLTPRPATCRGMCQRDLGPTPETKYYLVNLPITASLKAVVHLAHQRWAIEQQYAELKSELGLDDFVGRSYPGWNRHVALTALAYAFLQGERLRHGTSRLTFPRARAVMTDILTAYYFVTHQRKLKMLLKLAEIPLKI